jgi:hypothetical protein
MYQAIGKNKWDMYANCGYMQYIFAFFRCGFSKTVTAADCAIRFVVPSSTTGM